MLALLDDRQTTLREAEALSAELARLWAQAWKAIAKQYRQEARQLSIALDHGLENSNQVFEQLREERDLARQYAEELEGMLVEATRRAAAAEQTATALRTALWQFGDHNRHCATRRAPGATCNCGFAQALEISASHPLGVGKHHSDANRLEGGKSQ